MAFFVIVLLFSFILFYAIENRFDTEFVGLEQGEAIKKRRAQNILAVSFSIMEIITSSLCMSICVGLYMYGYYLFGTVCFAPVLECVLVRIMQLNSTKYKKWIWIRLIIYLTVMLMVSIGTVHVIQYIQLLISYEPYLN